MPDPAVSLPESLQEGEGPLVSVIVPTYNDSEFLGPALESIAAQTHGNVELIVVDSSDVSWLRDLAARVEGFTYLFQEPSGLAAARNRGLDAATGELIAFLDADDRWLPGKLDRQLAAVADGADVVYSDVYLVEDGEKRRQSALPVRNPETHHIDFLYEGGVPMPTVLARQECFADERFDERLPVAEDRHLWARLFARYRPARVAEPLACYTRREGSMSSDLELMYETELTVIDDLVDRLPDLAAHRAALERKAQYKYGKRLLRAGDHRGARHELRQAVVAGERDPRALALLAIAYVPAGHARLLELLERFQEYLR
jgi:glycosyltransferase involved in cell wall biosynthesis